MTFPAALPHGPITRVVDGVYAVRGTFRMGPGMTIGRTMTIVAAPDGLVIFNAVRLSAAGEEALAKLGAVKRLVKLSDSHGLDEPYYVDRYRPEVWVVRGSRSARVKADRTLGPEAPIEGASVIDFPGTSGWAECAVLVPNGGGTLITCDVLQNHCDTEGASTFAKLMTPLLGFKGGVIVAPMWRKQQKVSGEAVRVSGPTGFGRAENVPTGSLLAEMGMLIETQHTSTVVARTPIRALRITRAEMIEQMAEDPDLADHLVQRIASRLTALAQELRAIDARLGPADDKPATAHPAARPQGEVAAALH